MDFRFLVRKVGFSGLEKWERIRYFLTSSGEEMSLEIDQIIRQLKSVQKYIFFYIKCNTLSYIHTRRLLLDSAIHDERNY